MKDEIELDDAKVNQVRNEAEKLCNLSGGFLKEKQAIYLLLKEKYNYSAEGISDYFDISTGSVYNTIRLGKDKIRSMIDFAETVKEYPDWAK